MSTNPPPLSPSKARELGCRWGATYLASGLAVSEADGVTYVDPPAAEPALVAMGVNDYLPMEINAFCLALTEAIRWIRSAAPVDGPSQPAQLAQRAVEQPSLFAAVPSR